MTHFHVSDELVPEQVKNLMTELILDARLHEVRHLMTRCLAKQDKKDEWGKKWNEVTDYLNKEVLEKRLEEIKKARNLTK